jgi:hypothetical protein
VFANGRGKGTIAAKESKCHCSVCCRPTSFDVLSNNRQLLVGGGDVVNLIDHIHGRKTDKQTLNFGIHERVHNIHCSTEE